MMGVDLPSRMAVYEQIVRYFNFVDIGAASQTIGLLAPGASITFGPGSPMPGTVSGDALHEAMKAREAQTAAFTRHIVSTFQFDGSDGQVQASYILTLFRSDDETRHPAPSFVADVKDDWVKEDGGWLLRSREILPAFYHGPGAR